MPDEACGRCSAAEQRSEIASEAANAETSVTELDHAFFPAFSLILFIYSYLLKRVNSLLLPEKSLQAVLLSREGGHPPQHLSGGFRGGWEGGVGQGSGSLLGGSWCPRGGGLGVGRGGLSAGTAAQTSP